MALSYGVIKSSLLRSEPEKTTIFVASSMVPDFVFYISISPYLDNPFNVEIREVACNRFRVKFLKWNQPIELYKITKSQFNYVFNNERFGESLFMKYKFDSIRVQTFKNHRHQSKTIIWSSSSSWRTIIDEHVIVIDNIISAQTEQNFIFFVFCWSHACLDCLLRCALACCCALSGLTRRAHSRTSVCVSVFVHARVCRGENNRNRIDVSPKWEITATVLDNIFVTFSYTVIGFGKLGLSYLYADLNEIFATHQT